MQHCHTLLHAGILVTQDVQRRIIENGSLAINQGMVARSAVRRLAGRTGA